MDSILDDLNEAQRTAVTHLGGPLLVVAGAGSGKTRVITRRIAWRIREGLQPWQVLAITFTNKAAGEMRRRVERLVGTRGVWISTFHALGAKLLRMECEAAGLDRNFTIFDAADQVVVVRNLLKELKIAGKNRPRDFIGTISHWKNQGVAADTVEEVGDDVAGVVYRAYERTLRDSQALDFDDLLCRAVRLLEEDKDVRRRFAGRFATLLIDEYQDTNRMQYRLARLIAADHGDICGTGDPDQSIYRWRGAELRNILEFEKDFPDATVVKLEENYRSTNNILRAASSVIEHNHARLERGLWSSLGEGEKVCILAAETAHDEVRQVTREIRRALDEGLGCDEIAIFYRTNACSRLFEQGLRDENLPYVIVGAVAFYERREIKDLLAYLRVIANRHDSLDLIRVINVPSRGIGARTVEKLRDEATRSGRPLRDLLAEDAAMTGLRSDRRRALASFSALLRDLLAAPRAPVATLLDLILKRTDYVLYVESEDDPLVEERLENVAELRRAVREYDLHHPRGSLDEFLNETTLLRSRDRSEEGVPKIALMTLHSAKGLEFSVVFVAAVEEGILPHGRSMDGPEGVEEERRLLYVGMTRAKRRLTLSFARSRNGGGLSPGPFARALPSRFLAEIPKELCERRGREIAVDPYPDESAFFEPESFDGAPPFHQGDRVYHRQFGSGTVLHLSGFGPSARVTVDFEAHGAKCLILEYAHLRMDRDQGSNGL